MGMRQAREEEQTCIQETLNLMCGLLCKLLKEYISMQIQPPLLSRKAHKSRAQTSVRVGVGLLASNAHIVYKSVQMETPHLCSAVN